VIPNHALFKAMARSVGKLPTLPGVAMRILQAMHREIPNLREISEIIASDAPLSARVLQVVNSPFYGLSNRITSVHQAMVYLGLNAVKNLALSFSLINTFSNKKTAFDHVQFWKDSLIGAVAAKLITEKVNPPHGENAFFLGLLQDIGMLIMAQSIPNEYGDILTQARSNGGALHDMESARLKFNHMELGEYLTQSWGLPAAFSGPIGAHHDPKRLSCPSDDIELQTKILHLSSLYIDWLNPSNLKTNSSYGAIQKHIEFYNLTAEIDPLAISNQILLNIKSIFPIFEIQIDEKKYIDIIDAARNELAKLSSELIDQVRGQTQDLEKIKLQVGLDSLTQIDNHGRFLENLQHEMNRACRYKTPLSIIMGDLDHFKSINDFFGHLAGDYALKCVASQLKQMLRDSDRIARYGGEEFAVILPMTEAGDAMKAAERLRKGIEAMRIQYHQKPIALTMSFGVASMQSQSDADGEALIKKADEALYEAKHTGRNKCCFFYNERSQPMVLPPATVMVIDDEEVVLLTVTRMLERLGYAVLAARSGQQAVEVLQGRSKIDLVIMDFIMPDIEAGQLLDKIRQAHSEAKVVLSSGYNPAGVEGGHLIKFTDGFLQKPYQLAELSKMVQAAVENRM
jgi:diguanylate cyclase (GGDEF)-like protein